MVASPPPVAARPLGAVGPPPSRRNVLVALVGLVVVAVAILVLVWRDSGESLDGLAPRPSAYEQAYGTFDPVERSGTGNGRIEVPVGVTAGIITLQVEGPGRFEVGFRRGPSRIQSLISLSRAPTPYIGTIAFGLDPLRIPRWLHVWTKGDWHITIEPVSSAPRLPRDASGTADAVYLYDGAAAPWDVEVHTTQAFAVRQWRAGSAPALSLVSGTQSYEGVVQSLAGPSVVAIRTEGTWRITRE